MFCLSECKSLPFWPFLETHLLHLPVPIPLEEALVWEQRMPVFWFRLHEELAEGLGCLLQPASGI